MSTPSCRRNQPREKPAKATHVEQKKPGQNDWQLGALKCGFEVPRSVKHALELDKANGNQAWKEAMAKEIGSLLALNCFKFHSLSHKPPSGYQCTPLRMIFDVKNEQRRKGHSVIGGTWLIPGDYLCVLLW